MSFKEKVYQHFFDLLNEKIRSIESYLADLKASGSLETKSTAGDKHETALAMLQIEQENKRKQLAELMQQYAVLKRINPAVTPASIISGSLIETNNGWFFLSTALGKIIIDEKIIYALSSLSPLGQKFITAKINDEVFLNNMRYKIVSLQ